MKKKDARKHDYYVPRMADWKWDTLGVATITERRTRAQNSVDAIRERIEKIDQEVLDRQHKLFARMREPDCMHYEVLHERDAIDEIGRDRSYFERLLVKCEHAVQRMDMELELKAARV